MPSERHRAQFTPLKPAQRIPNGRSMPVEWSARVANGCTVLTISGPVYRIDASRIKLLLDPTKSLVVDMREITFLGPAGLNVLADAASRLANHSWPLAIVIGSQHAQVLRAIQDADLKKTVRLFETVEQALTERPTHWE
jgi:anti-anti-sigma factor